MKQGDSVPVTIAGQVVAQATVKEMGDGTATLVVPGTLVVMAVRTEIDPQATVPDGERAPEPATETIITGVDRASGDNLVSTPVDASGETPQQKLPPVTAPGEQGPTNAGTPVAPVTPAPTEQVAPVVADNAEPT